MGKIKPLLLLALLTGFAIAQSSITPNSKEVDAAYPAAHDLYLDLHEHPELSSHETQTAAKLAERLRSLGYEVTEHVGGTGIVAILKNGAGPTIMLRTELDALPVEEKTGLAYASKRRAACSWAAATAWDLATPQAHMGVWEAMRRPPASSRVL